MTEDQKNAARMESWTRYETAQSDVAALCSVIEKWKSSFEKICHKNDDLNESDFNGVPTKEEFEATVKELRSARSQLMRATNLARDNGFHIPNGASHGF